MRMHRRNAGPVLERALSRRLAAHLLVGVFAWSSLACTSSSTASDHYAAAKIASARLGTELDLPPAHVDPSRNASDVRALLLAPLTFESAVRIALLQNPTLRAHLLDVGISRGQLLTATLVPNPELDAAVLFSTDAGHDPEWHVGVDILPLSTLLARRAMGRSGRAQLQAARLKLAQDVLELVLSVRIAVLDLQLATELLALAQGQLEAHATQVQTARDLYRLGNIPALDLAQHEAAYETARVEVSEQEDAVATAREALTVFLGVSGEQTNFVLGETMPLLPASFTPVDRLESRVLEQSLPLAQARARIESAAGQVGAAQVKSWLPSMSLGVELEAHDGEMFVGPSLHAELPLFDQGAGIRVSTRAALDAERARYVGQALGLRSAARRMSVHAASAHQRATHWAQKILPLRRKILDETVLHYNAMELSVFQILAAYRDWVGSARTALGARHAYLKQRAALDHLLAGGAPMSMPSPQSASPAPVAGPDAGH